MALLNPYLSFDRTAREAMDFYQSVFGGELIRSTFGEFGMPGVPEDQADLIMHSRLSTTAGFTLMGADTPPGMEEHLTGNGTVSLSGDENDELRGYWEALADGGQITMPLEQAPWGDAFGQLTDRFGVSWMVNIAGPEAAAEG